MSRESLPWSGSHPAVASSHPGAPNVFLLFPALPALLYRHMPYRPDSPHFPDKSAVQKQYLFHHHKPVRLPFYPPENFVVFFKMISDALQNYASDTQKPPQHVLINHIHIVAVHHLISK